METSKYYTPVIEEFHVGFEYEVYNETENKWISVKTVLGDFEYLKHHFPILAPRVKYLDREDIESLGWKFTDEDTFKFPCTEDYFWEMIYRDMSGSILIRIQTVSKEWDNVSVWNSCFAGKIKNKSELIKLMKQLGINV